MFPLRPVVQDVGSGRSKICGGLGRLHKVSHENSQSAEPFSEELSCAFISSRKSKRNTGFIAGTKYTFGLSRPWILVVNFKGSF